MVNIYITIIFILIARNVTKVIYWFLLKKLKL